jgi:cobalamin synthase
MDDALQRKLDRIERRQWYILVLLLYPYLAGGAWLATESRILAAAAPALVIVVAAYLVTLVRARTGGSSGDDVETENATE